MKKYEEAEKALNEALVISQSLDDDSNDLKETIMCKLAYILYRRKNYFGAHDLFSDGKHCFACTG